MAVWAIWGLHWGSPVLEELAIRLKHVSRAEGSCAAMLLVGAVVLGLKRLVAGLMAKRERIKFSGVSFSRVGLTVLLVGHVPVNIAERHSPR